MDELLALVVERLVQNRRAAAGRATAPGQPVPPVAVRTPPAPAVQAGPPPQPAPPLPAPAIAAALPDAIFGGESPFGTAVFPTAAVAAPSAQTLLKAFGGGDAFLTAFVLGEALAPPVALREPRRT